MTELCSQIRSRVPGRRGEMEKLCGGWKYFGALPAFSKRPNLQGYVEVKDFSKCTVFRVGRVARFALVSPVRQS